MVEKVRNLGLIIDANLSMVDHLNYTIKSCNFHLHRLGKIRGDLTTESANAIAVSTVTSRLDYCNSTLWGLPSVEIERLQKVQNKAARIVSRTRLSDHITPILNDLHWLPVKKRIDYKVLSLAYSCLKGNAPEYLKETIPQYIPTRKLRSGSQVNIVIPSVDVTNKLCRGGRSFQNAAYKLWNSLPADLKEAETVQSFRRKLKTYLFKN